MKCFLHVIYDDARVTDIEGEDFADLAAARREAILCARHIVGDRLRSGEAIAFGMFEITDEDGRLLATVRFADALLATAADDPGRTPAETPEEPTPPAPSSP